jgi:hypothetical protein
VFRREDRVIYTVLLHRKKRVRVSLSEAEIWYSSPFSESDRPLPNVPLQPRRIVLAPAAVGGKRLVGRLRLRSSVP